MMSICPNLTPKYTIEGDYLNSSYLTVCHKRADRNQAQNFESLPNVFHAYTNRCEHTQITAVRAVDQPAQAVLNDLRTRGKQFEEQQNDGEGQTMQFEHRAQVGTFQVKAVGFQVAKHFFNPHAPRISFQGFPQRRQVGGQQPGFFFAQFPVRQDVGRVSMQLGQLPLAQPEALASLGQHTSQSDPRRLIVFAHQMAAFLAQNILPLPLIQLFQHLNRSKFRVSQHQHMRILWQELMDVVQQGQLSPTVLCPRLQRIHIHTSGMAR